MHPNEKGEGDLFGSQRFDLDPLEQDLSSSTGQGTLKNLSVNLQCKAPGLAVRVPRALFLLD